MLGLTGLQADRSGMSKDAAPTAPIIKKRLLDILLDLRGTRKAHIVILSHAYSQELPFISYLESWN